MCICGMQWGRRGWLAAMAAGAVSLAEGGRAWAQGAPRGASELLARHVTVDLHGHARGAAIRSAEPDRWLGDAMRAGSVGAVCLAHVPDGRVIGVGPDGVLGMRREPAPGELYRGHLDRLDWFDRLVRDHGVRRALAPADLVDARERGEPAIVQDVEGCDFLDGEIGRLDEAHARGLRIAQLVHYIPNAIGDFQTGQQTHGGLSAFGADVVRALNRLRVVIDVAHATEPFVRAAASVSTRPLLLSHTALAGSRAMGDTPLAGRQVSTEHARAVARTGGVIGVWHFFRGLDRYVQGIRELVDVVGVDHVGVGTDQQAAPGALQDYAHWPRLADRLLASGFGEDDTVKILGGNFLRMWRAVVGDA